MLFSCLVFLVYFYSFSECQLMKIYSKYEVQNGLKISLSISNYQKSFIDIFNSNNKARCISACGRFPICSLAYFSELNKTCALFTIYAFNSYIRINSKSDTIYIRKNDCKYDRITDGLIHYWPLCQDERDLVGTSHLTGGVNSNFIIDRFGRKNSAISLQNGYYIIPPGYYFNGDFTISAWIKVKQVKSYSRLISFGNNRSDEVGIGLSISSTSRPFLQIYSSSVNLQTPFVIDKWTHIAASLNGTTGSIYIDGILTVTGITSFPINMLYATNYLGRSNFYTNGDKDANAEISQVKLYNRSLSYKEIIDDFNGIS